MRSENEEKILKEKKVKAIQGVRDYLVVLLVNEKWCEANTVGEMLKELVGHGRVPFSGQREAIERQQAAMKAQQQQEGDAPRWGAALGLGGVFR